MYIEYKKNCCYIKIIFENKRVTTFYYFFHFSMYIVYFCRMLFFIKFYNVWFNNKIGHYCSDHITYSCLVSHWLHCIECRWRKIENLEPYVSFLFYRYYLFSNTYHSRWNLRRQCYEKLHIFHNNIAFQLAEKWF